MCIFSKERNAFCMQVDGARGEIFMASPITLEFGSKCVPTEPISTYGHGWSQRQSVHWKLETYIPRRNCETAIGEQYAMRHSVLMLGAEYSTPAVSLMALTECIHSGAGILPGRKCFMLTCILDSQTDMQWHYTIFEVLAAYMGNNCNRDIASEISKRTSMESQQFLVLHFAYSNGNATTSTDNHCMGHL